MTAGIAADADPVFVEEELLISNVSEAVFRMLQERSVSKAGLARKLGATKPWVTKLLVGQNLTLRSLARIAWHLGYRVNVTVIRIDVPAGGICECGHPEDDHKLPGVAGLVACYHRVDRDDPPDPDRKWCPCQKHTRKTGV